MAPSYSGHPAGAAGARASTSSDRSTAASAASFNPVPLQTAEVVLALLWQIFRGHGRGRPWLAGRRIGETSSDVGSSRLWIGWVTKHGDKCARSTCRDWIGPGDRKSVQPMAKRLALGACDQLHHFIAAGVWDA